MNLVLPLYESRCPRRPLFGPDHFSSGVALRRRRFYSASMELFSDLDRGSGRATSHKHVLPATSSEPSVQHNITGGSEMLTASQVCTLTGVPVSTLHDWAAKRERGIDTPGPHHIRLSGRHRRWTKADVEEWIRSARV